MKNIYILDEFQSAKQNGLGVFVKELANFLKEEFNISIIYTNSDYEEFSIETEQDITYYYIPLIPRYPFSDNAETVNLFISLWIEDTADNIFLVNHSPCTQLLTALKETHPLSKIIFVVHDLAWRMSLEADSEKYKNIIANRDQQSIKEQYARLLDTFDNELKFFALADKIVCLSEDTHSLLIDTYLLDNNKLSKISNGLTNQSKEINDREKQQIRGNLHIPQDEKILLYVGRINKMKGGDALLKCFSTVLSEYPNCRIVVIGNLNGRKTLSQIGNSVCKISFTGHIEKEEVYKWYSIADIGIIASYAEQCSYSAMEMMMHALPVVASDGYGVRNMFKNEQNAVIAAIGNRESDDEYCQNLSSAILQLLKSEDSQKKLSKANKSLFENTYRTKYMGEKYKELINSLNI